MSTTKTSGPVGEFGRAGSAVSPYASLPGIDSWTRSPTLCPARPQVHPGMTPVRPKVTGAPFLKEESKASVDPHFQPT